MTALVGGFSPEIVGLVFVIVFVGGLVKEMAGFGYAIVSTAVLAALISLIGVKLTTDGLTGL